MYIHRNKIQNFIVLNRMGKKKKSGGKSGKLAKMTEEERVLYLEQQRLAEEEMKKKKEDMLTQFLKVRHSFKFLFRPKQINH